MNCNNFIVVKIKLQNDKIINTCIFIEKWKKKRYMPNSWYRKGYNTLYQETTRKQCSVICILSVIVDFSHYSVLDYSVLDYSVLDYSALDYSALDYSVLYIY